MTEREAIRILKGIEDDIGYGAFKMQSLPRATFNAFQMAIDALGKQIPKPPIPDENATGIDGKPVPRCQVCGYALDLRMEQYCPCCGQRLTEYEEADT